MKHEEAIKWLKMQSNKPVKWDDYSEENKQIREEAERRMKEAFNMAIEALKAQEPKPVYVTVEINHRKIGECPNCRSFINSEYYPNYCGNCGQVVKWK